MVMLVMVVVATGLTQQQCHIDIHGSWSLQTVNDLLLLRGNKNASKTDFSDDGKGGKTIWCCSAVLFVYKVLTFVFNRGSCSSAVGGCLTNC